MQKTIAGNPARVCGCDFDVWAVQQLQGEHEVKLHLGGKGDRPVGRRRRPLVAGTWTWATTARWSSE